MDTRDESAGGASDPEPSVRLEFRPPRRRRKVLYLVAVVVFAVVGYLVFLMARGPDAAKTAERLVEAVLSALPEGELVAVQVTDSADGLRRALDTDPGSELAARAAALLQRRVATQVEADIVVGELQRAQEVLTAAAAAWPDKLEFDDVGRLASDLAGALQQQALRKEVAELVAAAADRMAHGGLGSEAVRDALAQLRRALELEPGNMQAQTMRADIRSDVTTEVRRALGASETGRANALLAAVGNEWHDNAELQGLRREADRQFEEMETAKEVLRLLDAAEQALARNRLTQPLEDNATAHFRRVLALVPGHKAAEQGLDRVGQRYVNLIENAIAQQDLGQARRLLRSLRDVAPNNEALESLGAKVEAAERKTPANNPPAEAASNEVEASPVETITDDADSRLWHAIKDSCTEVEIRRYTDEHPSGRYVNEAYAKLSSLQSEAGQQRCLDARR